MKSTHARAGRRPAAFSVTVIDALKTAYVLSACGWLCDRPERGEHFRLWHPTGALLVIDHDGAATVTGASLALLAEVTAVAQ